MSRPAIRYSTANPDLPAVCVSASDYDALAQRFRELQEDRQRTADELVAFVHGEHSAVCAERDTLRAEVEQLQARLRRIESIAECGSVQSWLALPDEAKAKWFGLHAEQDSERLRLRAEVERLREIREIARQCAANGGYLNSQDLIELRELLGATK